MNKITKEEFPELFAALSGETQTGVENLHRLAKGYLESNGTKTTIEGLAAIATKASTPVTLGDEVFYARVAKLGEKGKKQRAENATEILIIFDKDKDNTINTPSPFALKFREFSGSIALIADNELDPVINDPRYIELASRILNEIGRELQNNTRETGDISEKLKTFRSKIALGKKAISGYFKSDEEYDGWFYDRGEKRAVTAIGLAVITALYAHVPISPVDAKIGPIPMPYPAEFIVDVFNVSDHTAQGFDTPEGATRLLIGEGPQEIAVLPDYDTQGAPDTTYFSDFNESKQGLYEMDVPEEDTRYDDLLDDETGCYYINAKTTGGVTLAFTQSTQLVDKIIVEAVDEDTVSICAVDGVNIENLPQGSVFLYREN